MAENSSGTVLSDVSSSRLEQDPVSVREIVSFVRVVAKRLALVTCFAFLIGYGGAFLLPSVYSSKVVFLPPQSQPSGLSAALGSINALASLAGSAVTTRTPGDMLVSLLSTNAIVDPIIEKHKLLNVYNVDLQTDARKILKKNTNVVLGKRDGLIYIEVEDIEPSRAASIANDYVDQLLQLTSRLAISEAQQRRVFFEQHMKEASRDLAAAQIALQQSVLSPGMIRAEPKATSDAYTRLQSEIVAAEVSYQALQTRLQSTAPEVLATKARLDALRVQLKRLESSLVPGSPETRGDYIDRYREFKYQEALLELFTKQHEAARIDESREGGLIQVVDRGEPAERRSRPVRTLIAAIVAAIAAGLYLLMAWFTTKHDLELPLNRST